MTRALALGGGGVTGIAWEFGVLEGLRRSGVDLGAADTVYGTSAGSAVGARITTGSLEEAYAEQLAGAGAGTEMYAKLSATALIRLAVLMLRGQEGPEKYRRIGQAALKAHPEPGTERLEVIRHRIGGRDWPDRDLRISAVDIDRGAFVVFDASSGVSLVDAVAASCAVPLVWPPVRIDGTTYVDGGMRSPVNVDLLTGFDTIVALAPSKPVSREHQLTKQLERSGARSTYAIAPDHDAEKAMGTNSLDPGRRRVSAEAGLRQGLAAAAEVAAVWG